MPGRKARIWEQLKVSPNDLDEARRKDSVMEEMCSDYELVTDAMRRGENESKAVGEPHMPDGDLVRLKRELEQEIRARLLIRGN